MPYSPSKRVELGELSAVTTPGRWRTHSADRSENFRAARRNFLTYRAPKRRWVSVRLKRSTIPCWRWPPACTCVRCTPCFDSNCAMTPINSRPGRLGGVEAKSMGRVVDFVRFKRHVIMRQIQQAGQVHGVGLILVEHWTWYVAWHGQIRSTTLLTS